MVGRLYHLGRAAARARARELLDRFRLDDAADRPVKTYSGGMRRRLDLAGALVAGPGCCSSTSRPRGWTRAAATRCGRCSSDLVADGTTAAADHPVPGGGRPAGRRDRRGRPRQGDRAGHGRRAQDHDGRRAVELVVRTPGGSRGGADPGLPWRTRSAHGRAAQRRVSVPMYGACSAASVLVDALRRWTRDGVDVHDVGVRRPTLDDVFLRLTGHAAEAPRTTDADDDGAEGRAAADRGGGAMSALVDDRSATAPSSPSAT